MLFRSVSGYMGVDDPFSGEACEEINRVVTVVDGVDVDVVHVQVQTAVSLLEHCVDKIDLVDLLTRSRSEERRVGEECGSRGWAWW